MKNVRLRIGLNFVVVLFLLAAMVSTSYSWLAHQRTLNSSGMKLMPGSVGDYDIYQAYLVSYDEELNTYPYVDLKTNTADITMPKYDTIFIENNLNTAFVLHLAIEGADAVNGGEVALQFISNGSYYKEGTDSIDNKLSNVISIAAMISDYGILSEAQLGTFFDAAVEATDKATQYRFVSGTTNTNDISFSIPYRGADVADGILYIDIEIKYDSELITQYRRSHENDSVMQLELDPDLERVYITKGRG